MNVVEQAEDHFSERDECLSLLEKVGRSAEAGHVLVEGNEEAHAVLEDDSSLENVVRDGVEALEEFEKIVCKYQEQSHLLDSALEDLVDAAMRPVRAVLALRERDCRENDSEQGFPLQVYRNEGLQSAMMAVYLLCKVRGRKRVVKLMPHEVADLEPALWLLRCQDPSDYATWETRFSLLVWLSMLVLIPFDLETVDSSSSRSMVETVTSLCKDYLSAPGPTRKAAASCIARLLTRPDMESSHLEEFLSWTANQLDEIAMRREQKASKPSDAFLITGIFQAMVEILKHGHREKLISHVPLIFNRVLQVSNRGTNMNPLERKLTTKLVQRAGLLFLPIRVVKWRYQRGKRSLMQQAQEMLTVKETENQQGLDKNDDDDQEEDFEVPDEIEEVIEKLLGGLRDRDTIVRWSAAKGIGRITGRLPEELADDVVSFVLELFDASEGDAAWHGGCLALAELARRGLLLPKRLGIVVPLVVQALVYDVRRGHNSVGSHVRDAACYVCWAFARAYEPSVMAPHVKDLCPQMLVTALFDREVNCRRAASAAFQENVGRQGHENFPHGIEILTAADYFTLGVRKNAFLNISVFVAQFDAYCHPLIEHLVERKVSHWDLALRELSADSLHNLTPSDPTFMAGTILRGLLPKALSPDMLTRHGATLSAGRIVVALSKIPFKLETEMLSDIRNTVMRIEKARLYRGRGGEWMRVAVCELIESIAKSGHALSSRAQLRLLDSIEESMKHPKDEVKDAAVAALAALTSNYFGCDSTLDDGLDVLYTDPSQADRFKERPLEQMKPPVLATVVERIVFSYCSSLEQPDPNPAVRRGCSLALGVLPARFVAASGETLDRVVNALIKTTKLETDPDMRDAETRRNAVVSLGKLLKTVGVEAEHLQGKTPWIQTTLLSKSQVHAILDALLASCEDYETDNRGDVGSWVRVKAIQALVEAVHAVRSFSAELLSVWRKENLEDLGTFQTKNHGEVNLIAKFAEGEAAWVLKKSDGRVFALNCKEAELEPMKMVGFLVPPTCERKKTFLPEAGNKALHSIHNQEAILELGLHVPSSGVTTLDGPMTARIVCALMKQLSEKMGVVREVAGNALIDLLKDADISAVGSQLAVPNVDALRQIFEQTPGKVSACNWKVESFTFPRVCALLSMPDYMDAVLNGLVLSVGDLTESVSKNASDALLEWCRGQKHAKNYKVLGAFGRSLLGVLEKHQKVDRVVVSVLKAIDIVFEAEILTYSKSPTLTVLLKLHDLVKEETKGTSNVAKLVLCSKVFFHIASFPGPARPAALGSILILLGHKYPHVRKSCARQFQIWALAMSAEAVIGIDETSKEKEAELNPSAEESEKEEDLLGFLKSQHIAFERDLISGRNDVTRPDLPSELDAEEAFGQVQDLTASTDWEHISVKDARQARDTLYPLLRVHKPNIKVKHASTDRKEGNDALAVADDDDTYATLIHNQEMGYK